MFVIVDVSKQIGGIVMNKKVVKVIEYILCGISISFLLWLLLSWIDVVLHNLNPEPVYQWWNLFMILMGGE